jgi:hypothetical protein
MLIGSNPFDLEANINIVWRQSCALWHDDSISCLSPKDRTSTLCWFA